MFTWLIILLAIPFAIALVLRAGLSLFGVRIGRGLLVPPTIVLDDDTSRRDSKVERLVDELREAGYEVVGRWRVKETPGVRVVGLVHPGGFFGAVYRHPLAGRWADVGARFATGAALTVTTAPHGEALDQMPGRRKVFLADATTGELLRCLHEEVADTELWPVSPDEFKTYFEMSYAEEMSWRAGRGGATLDEIRRVGAGHFDDETILRTKYVMQREAREQLETRLLDAASSSLSPAAWARVAERHLFVHPMCTPDEIAWEAVRLLCLDPRNERLCDKIDRDLSDGALSGSEPAFVFERIQNDLPADRRLVEVARAEAPHVGACYAAPEDVRGELIERR